MMSPMSDLLFASEWGSPEGRKPDPTHSQKGDHDDKVTPHTLALTLTLTPALSLSLSLRITPSSVHCGPQRQAIDDLGLTLQQLV